MKSWSVIGLDLDSLQDVSHLSYPFFLRFVVSFDGITVGFKSQSDFIPTEDSFVTGIIHS